MIRKKCEYYWTDEGREFPACHCDEPEGWEPCNEDEDDDLFPSNTDCSFMGYCSKEY